MGACWYACHILGALLIPNNIMGSSFTIPTLHGTVGGGDMEALITPWLLKKLSLGK